MKRLFLTSILFLIIVAAKAQTTTEAHTDSTTSASDDSKYIFTAVEKDPSFKGGIEKFYGYLQYNLEYPPDSRKKKIGGKVYLTFVVERDGSLTDIKILRGVAPDIDAEAIRVISGSPKWTPGIQNGRVVRVQFSLGINFNLPQEPAEVPQPTQFPQSDSLQTAKIFSYVDKQPQFPGGVEKLYNYIVDHLVYPYRSKKDNIQGTVRLTFVVEKDGSLTDIRVTQSLAQDIDAEAIQLMKHCPKWNPGMQNGKPVRVQYSVPITFTLIKQN